MAALGSNFVNALLDLIFTNDDITTIGDAGGLLGSSTAGNLYISLHTGDPTAGNQTTSEADYTSYARVAVARSGAGWTVAANAVENAAEIQFPEATGGSNSITHWAVGAASSGAGLVLFAGARTGGALAVTSGVQPTIDAGDLDISGS